MLRRATRVSLGNPAGEFCARSIAGRLAAPCCLVFAVGSHQEGLGSDFAEVRQVWWRAARSTFRVAPADVVKALLDGGEARFDHRLEFEVGEDIGPVVFDAFADEFTDIEGIYAPGDAFPDHLDLLGDRTLSRYGTERPFEALGKIASRVHDLRADEPWTQHRYADPARREFTPQALGQRDNAILGNVVGTAAA